MRKRSKNAGSSQESQEKFLDVNASMQGSLRFEDPVNLRINGKFEGTLDTKGKLMVGHKADITADIVGENIAIAGSIKGNIRATKILQCESTARLMGDVEAPRLSIEEGAIINGRLHMTGGSSSTLSRGDWMTLNQLAKYLEVDSGKISEWVSSGVLSGTKEGGELFFDRSKVDQWISEGKVKA